jgi:adenine-specific DNA-methyltransferase
VSINSLINQQALLFPELRVSTPKTQGIKYAGSKLKLLPQILSLVDDLNMKTVFDGFSGSTRVSQAFAQLGYQVTSSDISEWSYILGTCYLKNKEEPSYYRELIEHLNSLEGYAGWFTENYGGVVGENGNATQKDGTKKPWQIR